MNRSFSYTSKIDTSIRSLRRVLTHLLFMEGRPRGNITFSLGKYKFPSELINTPERKQFKERLKVRDNLIHEVIFIFSLSN